MAYNYKKKAPLHPNEWGSYGVDPVLNYQPPDGEAFTHTVIRVPIVGSRHHGVTPFDLSKEGKPVIIGEPNNPFDNTALLVVHSSPDEKEVRSVGHIARADKWMFSALHPETWGEPGFAVAYRPGEWSFDLHFPAEWISGYHAFFNPALDPAERGGNQKTTERNWWLCGWLAARTHEGLTS